MKKHSKHKVKRHAKKSKMLRRPASKPVTKGATPGDVLRDIMNFIAVYKKEEMEGVTTRIDPDTADELLKMLEKLARSL